MKARAIPLGRWADAQLGLLAESAQSARLHLLRGADLLAERAMLNGLAVPEQRSAGGCRLIGTREGLIALNLARPEDRDLLPALFGDDLLDPLDDQAIATAAARADGADLVELGRELGLAIARDGEVPASAAVSMIAWGPERQGSASERPLVIDLSALWAGPLAAHLLWLAGAEVVKVESMSRPDAMRDGDPTLFALLNQGKSNVSVDFSRGGALHLRALLQRADIVIEAARPRALHRLGIDAEALVRERPGLTWVSVTGHGASGPGADWVGFGDDCGVAGGLSAALRQSSGRTGFVGDAIADPLAGIVAAREAWAGWRIGRSRRVGVAMSGVAAQALADEQASNAAALHADMAAWSAAVGQSFPRVARRDAEAPVRALGADNGIWLAGAPC